MDCGEIAKIHAPVMLDEAMAALEPQPGGHYLDCTLGLGGHTEAILARAAGSQVCGLDQDSEALELARERLREFGSRVHYFHTRFGDFETALAELGWTQVDGALVDLGVSSLQLDRAERGFSFRQDGPLDMRMDQASGRPGAWQLVNRGSHAQLRDCIAALGEEPQAGRIARHIVEERQKQAIDTTSRLAGVIWSAYPPAWRKSARRHPATKTFQALRMAVNEEPEQLKLFLEHIWDWLAIGGRVVVISFHSLEDRMVKQAFRARAGAIARILYKKPLVPSESELAANPRAASAKLRAAEKAAVLK